MTIDTSLVSRLAGAETLSQYHAGAAGHRFTEVIQNNGRLCAFVTDKSLGAIILSACGQSGHSVLSAQCGLHPSILQLRSCSHGSMAHVTGDLSTRFREQIRDART